MAQSPMPADSEPLLSSTQITDQLKKLLSQRQPWAETEIAVLKKAILQRLKEAPSSPFLSSTTIDIRSTTVPVKNSVLLAFFKQQIIPGVQTYTQINNFFASLQLRFSSDKADGKSMGQEDMVGIIDTLQSYQTPVARCDALRVFLEQYGEKLGLYLQDKEGVTTVTVLERLIEQLLLFYPEQSQKLAKTTTSANKLIAFDSIVKDIKVILEGNLKNAIIKRHGELLQRIFSTVRHTDEHKALREKITEFQGKLKRLPIKASLKDMGALHEELCSFYVGVLPTAQEVPEFVALQSLKTTADSLEKLTEAMNPPSPASPPPLPSPSVLRRLGSQAKEFLSPKAGGKQFLFPSAASSPSAASPRNSLERQLDKKGDPQRDSAVPNEVGTVVTGSEPRLSGGSMPQDALALAAGESQNLYSKTPDDRHPTLLGTGRGSDSQTERPAARSLPSQGGQKRGDSPSQSRAAAPSFSSKTQPAQSQPEQAQQSNWRKAGNVIWSLILLFISPARVSQNSTSKKWLRAANVLLWMGIGMAFPPLLGLGGIKLSAFFAADIMSSATATLISWAIVGVAIAGLIQGIQKIAHWCRGGDEVQLIEFNAGDSVPELGPDDAEAGQENGLAYNNMFPASSNRAPVTGRHDASPAFSTSAKSPLVESSSPILAVQSPAEGGRTPLLLPAGGSSVPTYGTSGPG